MGDEWLDSEKIIVSAPMSFTGAAKRAWKLTRIGSGPWPKVGTVPLAIILIALWWVVICVWYVVFSLLLVPYRLIRRVSRKRKVEEQRHREQLAMSSNGDPPDHQNSVSDV